MKVTLETKAQIGVIVKSFKELQKEYGTFDYKESAYKSNFINKDSSKKLDGTYALIEPIKEYDGEYIFTGKCIRLNDDVFGGNIEQYLAFFKPKNSKEQPYCVIETGEYINTNLEELINELGENLLAIRRITTYEGIIWAVDTNIEPKPCFKDPDLKSALNEAVITKIKTMICQH